ncbi:MAG: LCP family protein [Oscillospiraceae bacterium]|nr:LCP family protein [Oscillospiraceae bacterium]
MSNLSKPKKIATIAIIIAVLTVPVYLAFNDEGVQEAISSLGPGNGSGDFEKYLYGSARYDLANAPQGEAGPAGDGHVQVISDGAAAPKAPAAANGAAIDPAGAQGGGLNIIDAFMVTPTPKPVPTPTPKWEPVNIATDGELLIDGLIEEDSVNVLIIGVDRTAYLADTLGVVSISPSKQSVRLIMFSRDLYVGYSPEVERSLEKLRHNKLPGIHKINNTYNVARNSEKNLEGVEYNENRFENQAYDFLAQVIYEKFDIRVDDYVQINTYGLVRLVDTFGGVRVNVPVYMRYNDPDQNLNIHISKGSQVLNGSQAEGFVRFRQGYDSSGKLSVQTDRTANQIAFMKAFYEQHAKISNVNKIPEVVSNLRRNIIHSISADDIFTVYIDILTAVVNDSYTFETVEFDYGTRRVNGAICHTIKSVKINEDE